MQVILTTIFLGLLVVSCSVRPEKMLDKGLDDEELAEGLVGQVNARWHDLAPEWAKLKTVDGTVPAHFFWDVPPAVNKESKVVNFVVETPEASPVRYGLDISSGLHYAMGPYCPQSDSWRQFGSDINRPPFSIGFVPRILDQLMTPQKIIVFGNAVFYQEHFRQNYFEARVVGGYIEQFCPESTCQEETAWKSRLVLIGVQRNHPKYDHVKTVKELQELVDWKEVKAFIQNGQGKNLILKKYLPAYRMGSTVDASQALHFIGGNSHIFSVEQMKEMKLGCYKLYAHINKTLGHRKVVEEKPKLTENNNKFSSRVMNAKENKVAEQPFFRRFIKVYKKFHGQLKTCSDYVYPSNVQFDRDRHWMMSYIFAFSKLNELGYAYDCTRKAWFPNPLVAPGKRTESIDDQLKYCTAGAIDRAFGTAVQMLARLYGTQRPSYRYIDFDQGAIGTHNRMYSWVPFDGKVLECEDYAAYQERLQQFPNEIRWQNRESLEKGNLGDLIY